MAQTTLACDALRRAHPGLSIRIERITTTGDVRFDVPLPQLGRGMFVKEIEAALLERQIDIAVHSAKDLPSTVTPGLILGAFLPRADARDVLVSPHGMLRTLPVGARVGTSSPRRACQLRALRPDVELLSVRGNVDTRLRKLANGDFDALLLAAAGLIRLGRVDEVTEWLEPEAFVPSVGQGALAIEVRADDAWALELVRAVDHAATRAAVLAERAFLAELGAGCLAAAGANASVPADNSESLRIIAFIGDMNGDQVRTTRVGPAAQPQVLGRRIAHELLLQGGARYLARRGSALAGKVVAITRPADTAAELMMLLRAHGASPVACPTIAIEPLSPLPALDEALFAHDRARWIVFTSANAVQAVADHLAETGRSLPRDLRVAAVGDATARAAERRLRAAEFLPSEANAATLARELPDVDGATVIFPRGDLAAETLARGLCARGAIVREVIVYRTTPGPGVSDLADRAREGTLDAVVFASLSSVRFAAAATVTFPRTGSGGPVIVCIGPTTASAARDLGIDAIESPTTTIGGIVEALERALADPVPADRAGASVSH